MSDRVQGKSDELSFLAANPSHRVNVPNPSPVSVAPGELPEEPPGGGPKRRSGSEASFSSSDPSRPFAGPRTTAPPSPLSAPCFARASLNLLI